MKVRYYKFALTGLVLVFFSIFKIYSQTPTWNWALDIHTNQDEVVQDVEVDPSTGDIYIVGYWEDDLSSVFPTGALPSQNFTNLYGGNSDGFVAKYDNTGTLQWAFKVGCNREDRVNAISIDPSGNIYITGYFQDNTAYFTGTGTLTGFTSLTNTDNDSDYFLAKYNSNGVLLWVRHGFSTGNRDISGEDVAAFATGVVAVGYYNDDVAFGSFTITDDGSFNQHFLVCYDVNGNEQWVAHGVTNNHDYNTESYFNAVESDGVNIFISGNYKGPDFDLYDNTNTIVATANNANNGDADIVLISFTIGGVFNWMQEIGGADHDEDRSIVLDADSIYLTGGIGDNSNFPGYSSNPVNSSGNMDIFLSSHAKTDGNTGWVKSIPSTNGGDQMGLSATIDSYSNILVTGYYDGNLTFPSLTLLPVGGNDGFVASYANNGTFYWAKTIGSSGSDAGYAISANSTDKVYVGGYYEDQVDLDGNILTNDGRDNGFLAEINPCKDAVGGVASTTDNQLCVGESTIITLAGSEGSIQWQSSPKSADTWTDIAGETSLSFSVTPASSTDYRAVLTPISCNNDTSNVLTIDVHPLPTATISGNADICNGSATPINIAFTGTTPYDFTYTDGTTPVNVTNHLTNNYTTNVTPADTSTYVITTVTDGNGCTNTGTGSAVINVIPDVTITVQPVNKIVCPASNTSFTVAAAGMNLTYQWQKNGVDIAGETNSVLSLNSVAPGDDATYRCIVSSICGGPLTSNDATLTLYTPTSILVHPVDDYLCSGENLNLSINASGSNLTYEWRKDGIALINGGNISGADLNSLSITNVTTANAGIYTCMVTGSCGSVLSNTAVVGIEAPIVITLQPTNKEACLGGNTSFSVTATGSNVNYQWQKNGVDIAGETSQSLIISGVVAGDAGTYRCNISSSCGEIQTSNAVTLTVNTITQITSNPIDDIECLGGNTSFEVTATGSNLTYQWIKNGLNLADGGSVSGTLTNQLILTGLALADAGDYKCRVTGSCGVLESNVATLVVDDAIAITVQPLSQSVCEGNNIIFSVTATGSNLSYQWQKDMVDIVGETNSSLSLTSVNIANAGDYRCIISNSCGQSLNSNIATLGIYDVTNITSQPVDAVECIGNTIIFSVAATGSNLTYRWYKNGVAMTDGGDISGVLTTNLVIDNLDLTDAATYYCKVIGECNVIDSDPAVLTVDDNIAISIQPQDVQACETDNITFNITATGSNLSYQWQKNGINIAGETNTVLALNNITAADAASYRCVISNSCGSNLNSQAAELTLYTNTSITVHPSDITECIGQNANFTVTALGSNLTYQWKKNGAVLADGGNISGATSNTLNIIGILAGDNGVYTCEVTGSCNIVNSDPANLVLNTTTSITTHPSGQAVCPGANAVFNVLADGTNLSYQWQKDGINIVGETNSGLILNAVVSGDAGIYRCIVTGDCGTVISNGALLSINSDLTITSQPVNDEVCETESTGFSVTATGTGLSYQWQFNGVNLADGGSILGATTSNLTINPVTLADAGVYTCIITGACGNQTTDPATLIVDEETVITVQPQNKTACPNDNISYNVTATGSNLLYQWQKDGTNIAGETNPSILLNNVIATDAGVYRCIVTGDCGSIASNGASLTMNSDVSITTQPLDEAACEGEIVGFTIAASGTALSYQWKHNGINLVDGGNTSGSTTDNLVISPASLADAGAYTCEVTGTCSSVNSSSVNLTINETISISTHPQNKTGCPGEDIAFGVVASGTNLTYQWQKDGVNLAGETNSGILLTNINATDAGVYRCVVSGDCSPVNSNGATLTVNENTTITIQPANEEICEGESAGFVLTATGTGLNYQWKLNGSDLVDGLKVSGAQTNSLSIDPVAVSDAGVITCEVTGTCTDKNSNPVNLIVDENIVVTAHPVNVTACPTENVSFSVTASGTNLTYQWQKDGFDIGGETNPGITLTGVTGIDAGTYRCIITANCGTSISNGALLIVDDAVSITTQPTAVVNVCEGNNLNLNIVATGTDLTYQWQKNGANLVNGGNVSGVKSNSLVINNLAETDDGIYTCIITGSCASVTSNLSDVTVYPATNITQHPVEYTVVDGGNASFSVVAEGNSLTYQWQKDGVNLVNGGIVSGANTSILNLTGVAESDEGAYRCVVTGTCNTSNSNPANLIVNPTSIITTQPINDVRCVGESATFSIIASGGGLIYQWKKDGSNLTDNANISGSTTANLSINSVSLVDAGAYTCIVNAESSVPAILTVHENTAFNIQPVAKVRCEGDNAIFTIDASGDALIYQWQLDGVNLSDGGTISGTTTTDLAISSVVLADAGNYRCVLTGTCGTANSSPAPLTVYENTLITSQPVGTTICENQSHTFTVVADGDNLVYVWKKDGVNLADGGNISGAATANLVVSNANVADAGSYTCSITGECGSENSVIAPLVVNAATLITLHPVDALGCQGDNISFSILADGAALTYQWQKDGVNLVDGGNISGAVTANLNITGLLTTDAGSYVCVVTGTCGVQNSDPATLTAYDNTQITSQPTGSNVCEGDPLSLSVTANGGNLTYQWKKDGVNLVNGSNISGVATANLNIANATLADDGTYSCVITGSCGTENSNLAQVNVRSVTSITTQPLDKTGCDGDNVSFSVISSGHSLTYQWQKDGVNLADGGVISGATTPLLSLTGITSADAGSYRCIVTGTCGTDNSDPAQLIAYQNTNITTQPTGGTICENSSITLTVVATGDNITYQWKKGAVVLADAGNISGSTTASLTINNADISDAGTYSCEVAGTCGTENSSLATVVVEKQTQILTHPVNAGGCEGDNISFSMLADGESLTYQWQKDGVNLVDGGSISGALTSLLQITGVLATDAGSYRCVVTGNCGVQNSNPASLTAYTNTIITLQPANASICTGNQIALNISATGNNLAYQWKKGGIALVDVGDVSGAATANLIVNNADATDAGIYTCDVSGSCGNENSSPATIIVRQNTVVTTQPQDKTTCEGDIAVFTITATGENLIYQWQKDGAPLVDGGDIFGTTTSILTVNNLAAIDAGAYRCVVTGTCGIVNSDAANLVVNLYPSAAGVITGPASVCQGSSGIFYEVAAIPNANYYIWNLPVGVSILSGDSTRVIEVEFDENELGGDIKVRGLNDCGYGGASPALNVAANPVPVANAGADQIICVDTSFLAAVNPGTATGTWSVADGPAVVQNVNLFDSYIYNLREGTNTLVWTVEKNSCSSTDTVVIINNHVNVEAGVDKIICSEDLILEGSSVPSGAVGSWSVITGAASFVDGNDPLTTATGFATATNILKWSVTKGGCTSYDTVVVDNQRPTQAYAGIDQSICRDTTILGANSPVVGTGLWTVITGAAIFEDNTDPNTVVRGLSKGDNILRWTIFNGICSTIDETTIRNNQLNVDAGIDQVICDRTTSLDAVAPVTGTGNWSVVSGSAAFVNNNLNNTTVTGLAKGENILVWNINNNGCISSDTVSLTNDSPTEANAGVDQVLAVDFTTLQANIPSVGTGSWSLISGSAVIVSPGLYNTNVTDLALGDNIFRWTISHNSCISFDDVVITNFMSTATDAGEDQTICSDETTLDGNEPMFGFGEWSVISGSATFIDNSEPKTKVTALAKGDNVLRWSVWENGWTSDDVVITNDSPTQANAGLDQTLCADSTFLAGNDPIIGKGVWTIISGSGTFEDDSLYNTKVRNLAKGENIFKWTITNKSCSTHDLVVINNDLPTIADAGTDQVTCVGEVNLNPNTPSAGVGEWSVLSGSANFDENRAYNLAIGSSTLRWTIVNNACSSYDDVVVTNNEPSDANAGASKVICVDSVLLSANMPVTGTGVWTIQSGSAVVANTLDPSTKVTSLSQGINVFRWTITYNGCTKMDEVTINNALVEATAGIDQSICSETTVLEGNNPGVGTGTWTVLGGSGAADFEDANQPDTRVNGLDKGPNILRWTITNEICVSYDDVVITNNLPTTAFAGPDEAVCKDNTILQGNIPVVGTGEWSILSGAANIVNVNDATSTIQNLSYGVNTLRWTITNADCSSSDEVVISNNSTVSSNAGVDQALCTDSTVLYANAPVNGTGNWLVVSGSATFEDNNYYNTKIRDIGKGTNVIRWSITNGDCSSTDDVIITNNSPTRSIAGADQTICGNSTYLQANIPAVGTGAWTLVSGAATFVNGAQNNTQVIDLNPGSNTLRWIITNNGCTSYDDIIVYNDLPYEADAGADFNICGNTSPLYANDPVIGIGEWTVVSGSAVFDDNSKYDATVSELGFGSNTLRWTITYDKCTTYDEIVVSNDKADVYAGIDQTVNTSGTLLAATNPSTGIGLWTVIGGAGIFESPNSSVCQVNNMGSGLNTYRWSVEINGCVSFDDVSVTYNVPPVASFVITKSQGCPPLEVYFVNNSLDGLTSTWDFDDGATSDQVTVKHTYITPGVYKPSLTVVDNSGEVVTKDTTIVVFDQPEASFMIVNKEVYIPEEEAIFINSSTNATDYLWEFGDGKSSNESDPKYVYAEEGIYDIVLHAWSENNCYDSTVVAGGVEVYESGTLEFPTAFTPNLEGPNGGYYDPNDFTNNVFFPIGEGIEDYHMEIFNRWGILVFESKDFTIGWDGYYDNKLLDEGVYVWKVTGKYNNGKDFKKVGTVLLLH